MHFNVFEAAPENERDGPSQQQALQNGGNKVITLFFFYLMDLLPTFVERNAERIILLASESLAISANRGRIALEDLLLTSVALLSSCRSISYRG